MNGAVGFGLGASSSSSTAVATIADCAMADYSRDVTGELAVVPANAHRDDTNLAGHRPTEISLEGRAA